MNADEVGKWLDYAAAHPSLEKVTATRDHAANNREELMYLAGDEITILQSGPDGLLGLCEGVVGRFTLEEATASEGDLYTALMDEGGLYESSGLLAYNHPAQKTQSTNTEHEDSTHEEPSYKTLHKGPSERKATNSEQSASSSQHDATFNQREESFGQHATHGTSPGTRRTQPRANRPTIQSVYADAAEDVKNEVDELWAAPSRADVFQAANIDSWMQEYWGGARENSLVPGLEAKEAEARKQEEEEKHKETSAMQVLLGPDGVHEERPGHFSEETHGSAETNDLAETHGSHESRDGSLWQQRDTSTTKTHGALGYTDELPRSATDGSDADAHGDTTAESDMSLVRRQLSEESYASEDKIQTPAKRNTTSPTNRASVTGSVALLGSLGTQLETIGSSLGDIQREMDLTFSSTVPSSSWDDWDEPSWEDNAWGSSSWSRADNPIITPATNEPTTGLNTDWGEFDVTKGSRGNNGPTSRVASPSIHLKPRGTVHGQRPARPGVGMRPVSPAGPMPLGMGHALDRTPPSMMEVNVPDYDMRKRRTLGRGGNRTSPLKSWSPVKNARSPNQIKSTGETPSQFGSTGDVDQGASYAPETPGRRREVSSDSASPLTPSRFARALFRASHKDLRVLAEKVRKNSVEKHTEPFAEKLADSPAPRTPEKSSAKKNPFRMFKKLHLKKSGDRRERHKRHELHEAHETQNGHEQPPREHTEQHSLSRTRSTTADIPDISDIPNSPLRNRDGSCGKTPPPLGPAGPTPHEANASHRGVNASPRGVNARPREASLSPKKRGTSNGSVLRKREPSLKKSGLQKAVASPQKTGTTEHERESSATSLFRRKREVSHVPRRRDLSKALKNAFSLNTGEPLHGMPKQPPVLETVQTEDGLLAAEQWYEFIARNRADKVKRSSKAKKHILAEGPPSAMRGQLWFFLSEADKDMRGGLFDKLLQQEDVQPAYEEIERDLHRTFPEHPYFADGAPGRHDLQKVLRAFAQFQPQVGYCQGLNFVAGTFLMFMSPEQAFWTLNAVCSRYGMFSHYAPGMSGLHADASIVGGIIGSKDPRYAARLDAAGADPIMYLTRWILTLYTSVLPWESCVKVLDLFFLEGRPALLRVALAILALSKARLASKASSEEYLHFLLALPPDAVAPRPLLKELSKHKVAPDMLKQYVK